MPTLPALPRIPTLLASLIALTLVAPALISAQTEGNTLYNVTMLRAAPGEYNALIAALTESFALDAAAGDASPFLLRHSQGDQWDFMLIRPMGDFTSFHSSPRVARRAATWSTEQAIVLRDRISALTAYQEEWFARSIPLDELTRRFRGMGLLHIEMFAGLPGKRAELLQQRRMENRYYTALGRQLNVLFTREAGPNWDAMTIGFHSSLQSFAEAGSRSSDAEQDAAAITAGFKGVGDIGPYLRALLSYHRDTFAVPIGH